MTLARFSRMCSLLENVSPTQKAVIISESMSAFSNKDDLMEILSMEYMNNNIGEKRAIIWIANALGIFEDEVEDALYTWGDIGEAIEVLDDGNESDSEITLNWFLTLLSMDCSRINSNSYSLFSEAFAMMSAREKKWFVRYWLRTPRNGVNNKVPLKALAKYYKKKYADIVKYAQYNSVREICYDLERNRTPECILSHGQFLAPMLAKPRKGKEKHPNTYVDVKYDGNRYQIHNNPDGVIIYNRKGKRVTNQYPDIVSEFDDYPSGIFDAEIYPIEIGGEPAPHKLLAKRVHMKDKAKAVEQCPVKLAIFDLLLLDGISYVDRPLSERLEALKKNMPEKTIATTFEDTTIKGAYNLAIDWGFEGIMIKDADATYHAGKRSNAWLKYKPPRINLDVVITSGEYGKGKRSNTFGTFGISVKDKEGGYVSIGKIGTGFSDDDLVWLTNELKKNVDSYVEEVFYFLPRVVLEVTSDLVTMDADNNIGLRFPRCMRIRHDKYAADIDTIQRVQELI